MAYRALYREWRPKDFSHVVGQSAIIDTLRNQVIAKRIAHAYLFCGSRGTGKTSTAKILARAINCLNPQNGDPCGECDNCKRACQIDIPPEFAVAKECGRFLVTNSKRVKSVC